MRNQITSVAAGVALLMGAVDARKQLVANGSTRRLQKPVVEECDNVCIFKDNEQKNYWCFDFAEPNLKMGWEWKQVNNTDEDATPLKYFRQDVAAYAQAYFKVTSNLKIDNLYQNEFVVDIPSFKVYIYTGMIINENFQYCPGLGYNIDSIDLELSMIHKMQNCYITLLKNLWSVDGVWTGKGATLFSDCEWSQDSNEDQEVELDFTKWEFFDKITDQLLLGTADPESVTYCWSPLGAAAAAAGSYEDGVPRVQAGSQNMFAAVAQNLFQYASQYMQTSTTGSSFQVLGNAEDALQ